MCVNAYTVLIYTYICFVSKKPIHPQILAFYFQKQPPVCSVRKGVLRNFAKFTGKHLCQSLLFNKVADLRCNLQT